MSEERARYIIPAFEAQQLKLWIESSAASLAAKQQQCNAHQETIEALQLALDNALQKIGEAKKLLTEHLTDEKN